MLCLIIPFSIIMATNWNFIFRGDADFHYNMAIGNEDYRPEAQARYAPLFSSLAGFIVFNENSFVYVLFFLLGILTPMAMFLMKPYWQTVLIYFAGSHYFWYMMKSASQSTANLLFLGLFLTKNIYLRLLIVLLSIGAHSHGFLLTVPTLIILLTYENRHLFTHQ